MTAAHANRLNDMLTDTYMEYLHCLATEAPDRPRQAPDLPLIETPASFVIEFLTTIAHATPPIPVTRHGMDAALDALFAHPALRPLLLDDASSIALQEHFATTHLPRASAVFAAHWAHIIVPAWDQHRELQRALRDSTTS
jgi:hypothetical protein